MSLLPLFTSRRPRQDASLTGCQVESAVPTSASNTNELHEIVASIGGLRSLSPCTRKEPSSLRTNFGSSIQPTKDPQDLHRRRVLLVLSAASDPLLFFFITGASWYSASGLRLRNCSAPSATGTEREELPSASNSRPTTFATILCTAHNRPEAGLSSSPAACAFPRCIQDWSFQTRTPAGVHSR